MENKRTYRSAITAGRKLEYSGRKWEASTAAITTYREYNQNSAREIPSSR